MTRRVSLILPAHDEARFIAPCLEAVLRSDVAGLDLQVIVVANGCRDDTAGRAREFTGAAARRGITLEVIETAQGGKLNALGLGDAAAVGGIRIYLDADVVVEPDLIRRIAEVLSTTDEARYASGTPVISRAQSALTRAYARFWARLPFLRDGVPGFGIYAVNAAGRARWGAWPDIISDDTFARLQFGPDERLRVPARYHWPMVEGWANLVRVRRRQDRGVSQIAALYPDLVQGQGHRPTRAQLAALALRDPAGFAVYASVALAVRLTARHATDEWTRGR